MKKLVYAFSLFLLIGTVLTGCREKKTAGEKIQDGVEEVGDGIGDAVDNTVDKVDDAIEE